MRETSVTRAACGPAVLALLTLLGAPAASAAAEEPPAPPPWLLGGQSTFVAQWHPYVPGPYFNPDLSFGPQASWGWSLTISLLAGTALWRGAWAVIMPEYANGRGMPNPSGLSGYPNGEIIKAPSLGNEPYFARAFLQQILPLGPDATESTSEPEAESAPEGRFTPAGPYALRRPKPRSRIEITAGKFATTDFFDLADASSDPRHRFMNWALMTQGAWDYAADTRGYTWGLVFALEQPRWALRAGVAMMPTRANGPNLDSNLWQANSEMIEGEWRWTTDVGPGSAKLLLYWNHANMGSYLDALATAPVGGVPDIHAVERPGTAKYGAGLLGQQQIGRVSAFARLGWDDGQTETFCFTEIDRSFSAGAEVAGDLWGRPTDGAALGIAVSALSDAHARYLAAGGTGFQLGDGALSYAWETVAEAYYLVGLNRYFEVTADLQGIFNPGMNSARGPTVVAGVRLHAHL
jgi:high affinity Mn2+ porin